MKGSHIFLNREDNQRIENAESVNSNLFLFFKEVMICPLLRMFNLFDEEVNEIAKALSLT